MKFKYWRTKKFIRIFTFQYSLLSVFLFLKLKLCLLSWMSIEYQILLIKMIISMRESRRLLKMEILRDYKLVAEDPYILKHFDRVPFCETPLHTAAEKGQTHFAMELMTLKPSLALKLNASGFSPMHLALQNNHIPMVLLGWVKRANREEVLDWKDEDGKTVLHIAALTNQPEVMKLLRGSVKAKAKNLDGKTAMDILQIHQSPLFSPEATSSLFNSARERLVSTTITTLAKYLSKKPSFIEKWNNAFGLTNLSKTRNASLNSNDSRSVILVVAILIEDSKRGDRDDHLAGQMTMTFYVAIFFYIPNGIAFF
ncbi:BnaA01g17970D [Brassica napus]|uniref:BnaA01g17970D protein n=1 Tax=Brassica napus TaxID=3708 RepID=A0A078HYI7_BRANA|nr:BnaA01g17970D [Brassica napus]